MHERLDSDDCVRWLSTRFPNLLQDAHLHAAFSNEADEVKNTFDRFGDYLWLTLSHNCQVITRDNKEVNLGSFRSSSAEIAEWLNRCVNETWFHHASFYMGIIHTGPLTETEHEKAITRHRFIFQRLHAHGDRWICARLANSHDRTTMLSANPTDRHIAPDIAAYYHVYGTWPQ
jgi:hypothetical protein